MNTYYLRFASEEEALAEFDSAGYISTDGYSTVITASVDHALDVVGVIYNDDAVYDPETGEVVTPATPMDGWHVNLKAAALPDGWAPHVVVPAPPHRVFAGDPV
jgi:hypothetical protein